MGGWQPLGSGVSLGVKTHYDRPQSLVHSAGVGYQLSPDSTGYLAPAPTPELSESYTHIPAYRDTVALTNTHSKASQLELSLAWLSFCTEVLV